MKNKQTVKTEDNFYAVFALFYKETLGMCKIFQNKTGLGGSWLPKFIWCNLQNS